MIDTVKGMEAQTIHSTSIARVSKGHIKGNAPRFAKPTPPG